MASELYWVPVSGNAGYWEVEIEDIYFDQKPQPGILVSEVLVGRL